MEKKYIDKTILDYDEDLSSYFVLKRNKLDDAIEKLIKTANSKKISGVSLSTLSNIAYSDFSNENFFGKRNMSSDVMKYFKKLQSAGLQVAGVTSNSYAATTADCLFGTPLDNGLYDGLDISIPFYQFVFKGYKPMYSNSINAADDIERQIMLAVQSGTFLGFSVVGEYNTKLANTPSSVINRSDYEGNKELINSTVEDYYEFYESIKNEEITDYTVVSKGLTKTEFGNRVVVYANHNNHSILSSLGEIEAYGVLIVQ